VGETVSSEEEIEEEMAALRVAATLGSAGPQRTDGDSFSTKSV
jgi:hypothetical protein